jgi:F0F1-type ATP synthase assembly protein I
MPDQNPVQRLVKQIALNVTIGCAVILGILITIVVWDHLKPELFAKLTATLVIVWLVNGIVCYAVFKKYEVKQDKDDLY